MKAKIIEAYQVPSGNVSPDIFALPCVLWASKNPDGTIEYKLSSFSAKKYSITLARASNWICKDNEGQWYVMSDEDYWKEVMP